MFLVGKKTIYLAVYKNGEKEETVGFAQITGNEREIRLLIKIREAGGVADGIYPIYFIDGERETGKIRIKDGTGIFRHDNLPPCIALGIKVCINSQVEILGRLPENNVKVQTDIKALSGDLQKVMPNEKKQPEDKWGKLLTRYKTVHPFGDDRIFLTLKIEDLTILTDSCRKIMHNSFLLHGYYNYRHLILGKDCRLRESGKDCLYLGVPGVYYEREKQVAVMFGFEGFESADCVEVGKFGYYMREVEIC